MQNDLLAELHLAKLDFKSIQNIVAKNSTKLANLLKENTEYVKKIKSVSPHFKGAVKSMVSDCEELKPSLSKKSIKTIRRKFILRKSLISNDNPLKNSLEYSCSSPPTPRKISSILYNALHERGAKNNSKCKYSEIPSFPTECYSNSKIFSNVAKLNVNTTSVAESNSVTETGLVEDLVRSGFTKEKLRKNSRDNQCSASNSLLKNSPVKVLKRKASLSLPIEDSINSSVVKDVEQQFKPNCNFEKESEPAFCVISEVVGNAIDTFSEADDPQEIVEEIPETQLIIPKKTNDITKIKGWRRKQFFVEKPTTIEFYSIGKGSLTLQKKVKLNNCGDSIKKTNSEEPDITKNAFVCDSLDEFLDRDSELKIGFEIPHLFAEFGIKLTSNEIVSRPNLSEKDIKEVETRYCVPISSPCENSNLDEQKDESNRRLKRPTEYYPKPCKLLKVEECQRNSIKCEEESNDFSEIEFDEKYIELKSPVENLEGTEFNKTFSNVKLVNKFIALVVYPGPFMPLHPIVQYHLAKIRDYRTEIDENWANFAASAVLVDEKRYKRSILPVQCCVKMETNDSSGSASYGSSVEGDNGMTNFNERRFKLKKCSVVIEKLDSIHTSDPWCMIHNRYNCIQCGLGKSKSKESELNECGKKIRNNNEMLKDTVIVSPRASFDKSIATLLAKKVRLLKYNGDTFTSIDCLKTLIPNTIEFIKLNFVKESLLTGYINIWYLKPEKPEVRSRAFLTFSKTSPLPNAINLKSSAAPSLNNLPKIITEIISEENAFDSNEYAILHCNGKIWEIHGSLNIAFAKSSKNVEQVFTSVELPELKKLQEIAFDILHVKAVKWWVLDLTQKFRLIEVKSGNCSSVVIRKKFIQSIAMNLFGFLPLRTDSDNRVLGAYIFQRLVPFVLIGPYYLLESHNLTLKGESSAIPFTYYGENNVGANYPLKFFINTVIKNIEQSNKKLEGLWLYDKMNLDSTSYLEVVTTNKRRSHLLRKFSSIDIEHGYSLSSLTKFSTAEATSGIIKRKNGKVEIRKVIVYLYFDLFDLGFVEGELQFDNSVIISHPLDRRTKIKSHKIGDCFIGIIKRRIKFIPKNLTVKWFITKHKDDLRNRRPFNKFFLDGAHILTKKGIYYLLEMSESKIEKLGLDKSEIFKTMAQCEVIKEVKELRNLANLLAKDPSESLTMDQVLARAVDEVKKLNESAKALQNEMVMVQRENLNLVLCFFEKLNLSRIPVHVKMKMIERVEFSFKKQNRNLSKDLVKKLNISRVGRRYLKSFEKNCKYLKKIKDKNLNKTHRADKKKKRKLQSEELQTTKNRNKKRNVQTFEKPSATLMNASNNVIQTKADRLKYPELQTQIEKLNSISDQCNSFKNIYTRVTKNCTSGKERTEETFESKKVENNEFEVQNSPNNIKTKSDGFVKLTSSEVPDNIKLYWKELVC